jgi:hypothetical protein
VPLKREQVQFTFLVAVVHRGVKASCSSDAVCIYIKYDTRRNDSIGLTTGD